MVLLTGTLLHAVDSVAVEEPDIILPITPDTVRTGTPLSWIQPTGICGIWSW